MGNIANFTQGFDAPDNKYVCGNCFNDYAIKEFIRENAIESKCDYCQKASMNGNIAASMKDVVGLIFDSISYEFENPKDAMPEYVGKLPNRYETEDLFDDWGLNINLKFQSSELKSEIINSIENNNWIEKDYFMGTEDEYLNYAWSNFKEKVKYHNRYTFLRPEQRERIPFPQDIQPSEMLDKLSEIIKKLELEQPLIKGEFIFRARIHNDESSYNTAKDLGPPPVEKALSGRMNSVGIPVFYGALNSQTAINETYQPVNNNKKATVGKFVLVKPINVLDLTDLKDMPSIFDKNKRDNRSAIKFFKSFVDDISQPITKDGQEHIDYVPSQIVSEYLRYNYTCKRGNQIEGILYPSSKDNKQKSCVLFINNEHCFDDFSIDNKADYLQDSFSLIDKKIKENKKLLKLESSQRFIVKAGLPIISDPEDR